MQRLTGVRFVINCARLITAGRIGRLLPGMSAQLQPGLTYGQACLQMQSDASITKNWVRNTNYMR